MRILIAEEIKSLINLFWIIYYFKTDSYMSVPYVIYVILLFYLPYIIGLLSWSFEKKCFYKYLKEIDAFQYFWDRIILYYTIFFFNDFSEIWILKRGVLFISVINTNTAK